MAVFAIGILIPTTFLIYLGLASLRAENELLKRETRERLGASATAIQSQTETALQTLWESMESFSRTAGLENRTSWTSSDRQALNRLRQRSGFPLEKLWILDAQQRFVYPYRDTKEPVSIPPLSSAFAIKVQDAEKLEFTQPAQARSFYETLSQEASAPYWKALFLMRAAACAHREKNNREAERLYARTAEDFSTIKDSQGFPYGVLAGMQRSSLLSALGQTEESRRLRLQMLDSLHSGTWDLAWTDEVFLTQRLMDSLPVTEQQPREIFQQRQKEYRAAREWLDRTWPMAQRQIQAANRTLQPSLWLSNDGVSATIVVPVLNRAVSQRSWLFLGQIPRARIEEILTHAWTSWAGASNIQYRFGKDALTKNPSAITITPESLVPTFPIQVFPSQSNEAERLAKKRRRIALGIVALAVIVIGVALIATWMAVSREMEMAQLKSRFVASMSHELKTPLSIIDLIGQKLKLGRVASDAEQKDFYSMLTDETARLKGLIEEVLDFSRLMENRVPYRLVPMDWIANLNETLSRFKTSVGLDDNAVQWQTGLSRCPIQGDAGALSRAVLNLLDNAHRYSPPNRLHIRVTLEKNNETARLMVEDQGYGVDPSETKLIFERFFRGSASTESTNSGAGLGLSIVRHIVEAHHGQIVCRSTPGKGSQFIVTLPWNEETT